MSSEELSQCVIKGMQERKAVDVVLMDLQHVKNAVADFFVICSANSDTQADAIADSVEKEVYKLAKEDVWRKEGKNNREWILLDYVNVVVHIFQKEKRTFFNLENLWGDAEVTHIEEVQN